MLLLLSVSVLLLLGSVSGDSKCISIGGTCQIKDEACDGGYAKGICSGAWNRLCCVPKSECTLTSYTNTELIGDPIKVDSDFTSSLDDLNTYASDCGVQVHTTHTWRKLDQKLDGTVVEPASDSSHLVGHAIDFNLQRPGYVLCTGSCMLRNYNAEGSNPYKCFLKKAMAGGLRWGGIWSEPDTVHIDDGTNVNDKPAYYLLRKKLQAACQ